MAVCRVEKTKDYTTMSNFHLRDPNLSNKARGLLSTMLSLPEDWDYTTRGLAKICKDGVDGITAQLKELEQYGYLIRHRIRDSNGRIVDMEYVIMLKILIAEDDRELRQLFSHVLTKNGYAVKGVSNGKEALDAMDNDYFDLVITDIMMPVLDGYELVRQLRDTGNITPVLMITAKDAFDDMSQGFVSGTDDYMVKPVNVNEMLLRVKALLRRAQMINDRRQVVGNTVMELDSLTVTTDTESMVLPQKEFMLLYKMLSYPGKIFTRNQLMDEIWGYDNESDTHTVDVHIGRLRERFRNNTDFKIVTMRGVGYKVVKL